MSVSVRILCTIFYQQFSIWNWIEIIFRAPSAMYSMCVCCNLRVDAMVKIYHKSRIAVTGLQPDCSYLLINSILKSGS